MELPRIGNEAIKKELNCNCSCRAHDIYMLGCYLRKVPMTGR